MKTPNNCMLYIPDPKRMWGCFRKKNSRYWFRFNITRAMDSFLYALATYSTFCSTGKWGENFFLKWMWNIRNKLLHLVWVQTALLCQLCRHTFPWTLSFQVGASASLYQCPRGRSHLTLYYHMRQQAIIYVEPTRTEQGPRVCLNASGFGRPASSTTTTVCNETETRAYCIHESEANRYPLLPPWPVCLRMRSARLYLNTRVSVNRSVCKSTCATAELKKQVNK